MLPTWYDVDNAATLIRLMNELETLDSQVAIRTRKFLEQKSIHQMLFREG